MISLGGEMAAIVHQFFEVAAMGLGVALYRRRAKAALINGASFYLLLGCILGAGIGNKLLHQLQHPELWWNLANHWQLLLSGQSLLGGLIGGWLGVEAVKYRLKINYATGDTYVVPLCASIALGRIGCFFAGLHEDTHGAATHLPWGVDLGDGVYRHPVPVYEVLWALLALIIIPELGKKFCWPSGAQFRIMLATYCLWRLYSETLKPAPPITHLGLSAIQWAAFITLIIYLPLSIRWWRQQKSNQ
jgi:phosphatidylglycerol---prolipoprotein diacylglyceryl transferase